jgi:hypothetical protein
MNGESFLAYVRQFLVPCLRRGDIVIMDMCGRPLSKQEKSSGLMRRVFSGADMCPASDAAAYMPRARMGVCGSDPIQSRALEALIHDLVLPIPPLERCAIPSI